MPELKAKVEVESKQDCAFGTVEVTMPQHECDIYLVMPNGDQITLQYRLEAPSLDVIVPGKPVSVPLLQETRDRKPLSRHALHWARGFCEPFHSESVQMDDSENPNTVAYWRKAKEMVAACPAAARSYVEILGCDNPHTLKERSAEELCELYRSQPGRGWSDRLFDRMIRECLRIPSTRSD